MIPSVKCLHKTILLLFFICLNSNCALAQATKETLLLKEQISKLQEDLSEQKTLSSNLLQRLEDVIKNQNQLIIQFEQATKIIQGFSSLPMPSNQSTKYKDAFLFSKEGKKIAFIDDGLKLYEYYGGNLIGWINPETDEIVRNFDNSIVAKIEGDFILDETGHAIGSIERSENMRWDRERLYSQVQKNPISQYFIRLENPKQFNLSTFRYSDWSTQKLEDLLFFSDKKIQKLK
ncbi:MAG: hypothetical protein A3B68_04450 [Candidatus Melainabacteria bacterium RIFCSPHIGHO2_02_FULL_34_12]|nr:MAG: hypothetical protein A3B68_04450 [Candidatus Melainabacteria bacterium RIFCSPHIGHO2_02_FULL_34_12]